MDCKKIQVNGTKLAFRQTGESGPPLVFIHGWADSSVVWQRSMEYWAGRYQVVALDQPGHGASGTIPPEQGVEGIATRLAEALDTLGLQEVNLVGHSFGGLVALRLALDFPTLVSRLALVNAAWSGQLPPPLPHLLHEPLVVAAMKLNRPWRSALGWLPETLLAQLTVRQREQLRRWREFNHVAPEWLYHTITMITANDLRPELPKIEQPTLVVAGTDDPLILPKWSRELAERLPNSDYAEVAAGHHVMEDNFPAFRQTLDAFLRHSLQDHSTK